MVTDTAQHRTIEFDQPVGLMSRATAQMRQLICGLRGHDALLHFEQGRMSLQCTSCGYETPGWEIKGAPASTQAIQPPRRVIRLPLVSQRRVA
jgi:hypothetical protein